VHTERRFRVRLPAAKQPSSGPGPEATAGVRRGRGGLPAHDAFGGLGPMDPNNTGPEEYGHDGTGHPPPQRPPREALTPDFGQPALARTVQPVSGHFLLNAPPGAS